MDDLVLTKHERGPTEIWTRIAGFKVQSANHYTMGPRLAHESRRAGRVGQSGFESSINQQHSRWDGLLARAMWVRERRASDWPVVSRPGGATVARLTPDQKVACSNHVRVSVILINWIGWWRENCNSNQQRVMTWMHSCIHPTKMLLLLRFLLAWNKTDKLLLTACIEMFHHKSSRNSIPQ